MIVSLNVYLLLQPWSPKEQDGGLLIAPSVIPVHMENLWWMFLKDKQASLQTVFESIQFPTFPTGYGYVWLVYSLN